MTAERQEKPAGPVRAAVRLERDGDVGVIVIDNPPVNAFSSAVGRGVLEAVKAIAADPDLIGAVMLGAGTTFVAGADIREFNLPAVEPQLPDVVAAVQNCPKPVVAALHGTTLGGGFELALGCDARVALPDTVMGFPEVTLGIIPGAGGTQRLPRVIGIPAAIGMICSAERWRADKALKNGLVNEVFASELRANAVRYARNLAGRKSRILDRVVPAVDAAEVSRASASALRAGKSRPAIRAAIEAIGCSAALPAQEALKRERSLFQELRVSREARALRYQFFSERDSAKVPHLAGVAPRSLATVAVIGAGTMGSGIAIAALDAGFKVIVVEQDGAALERGATKVRNYYAGRVTSGKLAAAQAAEREARLRFEPEWQSLHEADLVVEAVFEDLAVKQAVFRRLDGLARQGAVLASNTSYLDLDAIAAATGRPQEVLGLHFFSPAQVMRLLEVVRGKQTAPDVLATGLKFAKALRKIPVVAGNAFGFIGNRIYAAYRRQCEFMLEEGAAPQQVDAALESFGFAMGPFAVGDLSGLDIAWRLRQSQAASRDPRARYVRIPDLLCEAGRLGQKTGAGYYRYDKPGAPRQIDPAVEQIIDAARREKGIVPRSLEPEEITRRALLAMANEAALVMREGVAQRASDIDIVLVNGYGFPRWEGGVVFWARERGARQLAQDLPWLEQRSGPGFVSAAEHIHLLMSAEG